MVVELGAPPAEAVLYGDGKELAELLDVEADFGDPPPDTMNKPALGLAASEFGVAWSSNKEPDWSPEALMSTK